MMTIEEEISMRGDAGNDYPSRLEIMDKIKECKKSMEVNDDCFSKDELDTIETALIVDILSDADVEDFLYPNHNMRFIKCHGGYMGSSMCDCKHMTDKEKLSYWIGLTRQYQYALSQEHDG